ncbi:MAG: hypothetical protein SNG35_03415 [Rikenellaceae bacterium]
MAKVNLSKFVIPILIATIAISVMLCVKTIISMFKADAIFFSDIVTLLAQISYVVITVFAFLRNPIVKKMLLYTPLISFLLIINSGGVFFFTLIWTILTSLVLYFVYQIKKGDVPYWELITGEKGDDMSVKDRVNNYLNQPLKDGPISKSVKTIVIVALAALVVLLLFARAKVDFNIQWNMFESWMLGLLYPIGFIMTLSIPVGSFTPVIVEEDEWGNKKTRPNNDITEVMFASIFLPVIIRFAVYPLVGAALIYYPIMCVVALVEALVPYLFIALIAAFIPLYLFIDSYLKDRKSTNAARVAPIATLACAVLLTLVWLQNTNNKMDAVFNKLQITSSEPKTEKVIDVVDPIVDEAAEAVETISEDNPIKNHKEKKEKKK